MRWRLILILFFGGASVLFINIPEQWQATVGVLYAELVYPAIQRGFSSLPQLRRTLLSDVLIILLPLLLFLRLIWLARKNLVRRIPLLLLELCLWPTVIFFLLSVLWGLNYQRPTLKAHLIDQGFSQKLVEGHWQFAIAQTAAAVDKLPEDLDVCSAEPQPIHPGRPSAFSHSAMTLANLPIAETRDVKASHWSYFYQRLNIAGFYNPLTGEPTYSNRIYPFATHFTALHEYGHWTGLATEYDADILAYWSAWLSPDPLWQYSAWLAWWNDIEVPEALENSLPLKFRQGLHCYRDFNRHQVRWSIEKLVWGVYEQGIKSQGVSEGLASYSGGEVLALTSYQDWLFKKRNR